MKTCGKSRSEAQLLLEDHPPLFVIQQQLNISILLESRLDTPSNIWILPAHLFPVEYIFPQTIFYPPQDGKGKWVCSDFCTHSAPAFRPQKESSQHSWHRHSR